jgi:hypothetical protein
MKNNKTSNSAKSSETKSQQNHNKITKQQTQVTTMRNQAHQKIIQLTIIQKTVNS